MKIDQKKIAEKLSSGTQFGVRRNKDESYKDWQQRVGVSIFAKQLFRGSTMENAKKGSKLSWKQLVALGVVTEEDFYGVKVKKPVMEVLSDIMTGDM